MILKITQGIKNIVDRFEWWLVDRYGYDAICPKQFRSDDFVSCRRLKNLYHIKYKNNGKASYLEPHSSQSRRTI